MCQERKSGLSEPLTQRLRQTGILTGASEVPGSTA